MRSVVLPILLLLLISCQSEKTDKTPTFIKEIKNNTVFFADNSSTLLEHWSKPDYINFVLVRHAEKTGKTADDLSKEGQARAQRLGKLLSGLPINYISTTKFYRTRLTAGPVAYQHAADLVFYTPNEQNAFFEKYIKKEKGKNVFVVGHSNTIPKLLNFFVGEDRYPDLSEDAYDNIYFVSMKALGDAEVLELKF